MANRVLTLDEIEQAKAETRTRGEYLTEVRNFFESGELAWDFSEKFPGKESATLRNSVNQNAKKIENRPQYQILMVQNGDKKRVVLLNMDVYHAQKQLDNEA